MRKVWVRLVEEGQPDDAPGCWVEMSWPGPLVPLIKPGFRIVQVSDKGPQETRPGGEGN